MCCNYLFQAELLIKEKNWSSSKMIVDDRSPMMNGADDDDNAITMRVHRPPIAKKPRMKCTDQLIIMQSLCLCCSARITWHGGVMTSSDNWTPPSSASMQRQSPTDNSKHHQVDRF
jgi:hypothetical protein